MEHKILLNEYHITAPVLASEQMHEGQKVYSAFITVEEPDDRNNVFSVDGTTVRNDLVVLPSHMQTLANGQPPHVAKPIRAVKTTTDDGKKAVKMDFVFLATDTGRAWETVANAGVPIDFSTGVMVNLGKAQPRYIESSMNGKSTKEQQGYHFQESEVFEVSCVARGVNRGAKLIQNSADEASFQSAIEKQDIIKAAEIIRNDVSATVTPPADFSVITNQLTQVFSQLQKELIAEVSKELTNRLTVMEERLDEIASNLVANPTAHTVVSLKSEQALANQLHSLLQEVKTTKRK